MNCSHCGTELPSRPRARLFTTGLIFIAVALVPLFFVHLAVVVLASVLSITIGTTMIRSALKAKTGVCRRCGRAI
jgi:hypothetical protein